MSKFKIGDIVKATKESNEVYDITNEKNHFVGEVVENTSSFPNSFWAMLGGEYDAQVFWVKNNKSGREYVVNEKYFELVYPEVKENESKDNSCDKEKSGYYLECAKTHKYLGKIGNPTPYKDNEGNALFVGDVVEVVSYIDGDEFYAVEKVPMIENDGKQYIMFWASGFKVKECGELDFKDNTVKKIRSYKDVKNGEVIRGVKYIKENKNDSKRDSKKG